MWPLDYVTPFLLVEPHRCSEESAAQLHGELSWKKLTVPQCVKEYPWILLNSNVHYLLHNIPPLFCVLNQINPIHVLPSYFFAIRFNIFLSCIRLPSVLFRFTLYAFIFSPIHTTCPVHLVFLYFIAWIMFSNEHESLSSSLCRFLHSPVTSSHLGPTILLSTIFSISSYVPPSLFATEFHTHTKQQAKL